MSFPSIPGKKACIIINQLPYPKKRHRTDHNTKRKVLHIPENNDFEEIKQNSDGQMEIKEERILFFR